MARRPPRRTRIALGLFAFALVAVVSVAAFTQHPSVRGRMHALVSEAIRREMGLEAEIGPVYFSLPLGITADYNGPDVRQVSVRGVSADLNSVTMDGVKVATAQSANFGRAFEFEQASLGNIETIEVTKAATPDMDADSIGGSVNLVTKSAFDSKAGRRINYSLGMVTGPNRISHLRVPSRLTCSVTISGRASV